MKNQNVGYRKEQAAKTALLRDYLIVLNMIYSLALGPNSIVIIHDTKITRIIAPNSDGTIAIPAICGPQAPSKASPRDEPTSPAIIFAIQFIEPPL